MRGGGGRVRPLTAHSKLEPLRDGQGASDKPRDQREDWKRFRISWVKCDSGKMLSQHACMSSMKIFIRKVNTFLSSSLSYRKEESTYFIVLTFTKCSTNTHASSPNRLGDGPSPAARSTWRPWESRGPRWIAGPADRPASCWRRGPSQGCDRKENRISQEPRHPGQEAELPFALSSPSAKRRSEKTGENEQLWEETSVRLRAKRPTGSPLWGQRAEGPEPPRQLDVNSAAWKEGGHWPGGRGSAPPAAELRAAPSFLRERH